MSPDELNDIITNELDTIWFSLLSKEERQQRAELLVGKRDNLSTAVCSKLDAIILKQAETLGWKLLLSVRVQERFSRWEQDPNGPELIVRLGKALAKSLRIVQRRELPPIDDPDLVPTQVQTTRELRTVLREVRKAFPAGRANRSARKVSECFVKIISHSGTSYPLLEANLLRWQRFFEENPTSLMAHTFGKRLTPAALFYEWLSFCKGHDPETLRKMVSSLRSLSRN
jgi:hypothetical protein